MKNNGSKIILYNRLGDKMETQQIKIKNSKRFSRWAKKYDKSLLQRLVFSNTHDMFIKEITCHTETADIQILDVGCGTGELISRLSDHSDTIGLHGIDISADMIETATSKSRVKKNVRFKIGDVEDLPYENGAFDIVTCSHSFHHYPDQKKAVSEMHRVLKDNGKLIIADGSRDKLMGKIIFGLFVKRIEKDVHHIRANDIRELFNLTGFYRVTQKIFNSIIPLLLTTGIKEKKRL